jgi:tetratricopeptide (TPR) repeat protein
MLSRGNVALFPDQIRAQLAQVSPELGAAAPSAESMHLLAIALRTALSLMGVSALVLDDLQYADDESLSALDLLIEAQQTAEQDESPSKRRKPRPSASGPLWLLMASRQSEVPGSLVRWLASTDTRLQQLELPPFALHETEELLALLAEGAHRETARSGQAPGSTRYQDESTLRGLQQPGLAAALHKHAFGNPLFMLETLRALWDGEQLRAFDGHTLPVPHLMQDLLERRIAQLSEPALQLARLAALADDALDVELACVVLQTHPLALAPLWLELERQEVIEGTAFVYDVLREAVQRGIPKSIALAIHARIAQALAASGNTRPATHAWHWQAAGRHAEAAHAHTQAALDAGKRRQRPEEFAHWSSAMASWNEIGDECQLVQARSQRLQSQMMVRGVDEALNEACLLLAMPIDQPTRLRVLMAQLGTLALAGRFDEARFVAPETIHLAETCGDRVAHARAELFLIQTIATHKPEEALVKLQNPRLAADCEGDLENQYEYESAMAYVLRILDRRSKAAKWVDSAVRQAHQLADPQELMTALSNRAVLRIELGQSAGAYDDALRSYALHEAQGKMSSVPMAVSEIHLAASGFALGHLGHAIELSADARQRALDAGATLFQRVAELYLAKLHTCCGSYTTASKLLDGDWSSSAPTHQTGRWMVLARLARLRQLPVLEYLTEAAEAAKQIVGPVSAVYTALEHCQHEPLASGIQRLRHAREIFLSTEYLALAQSAHGLLCRLQLEHGQLDAALADALACWASTKKVQAGEGRLLVWRGCAQVFAQVGEKNKLADVLADFRAWMVMAIRPPLPPLLATTMRERNPDVRWLLGAG